MNIFYRLTAFLFLLPLSAFAQCPPGKLCNPVPGAGLTLADFIYLLLEIVQLVGVPVLVICIIYAGFLLVTAGGNEAQTTKAKTWIFWTLIGAAIILGAKVIAGFIGGTVTLL